jgi:nucleotide-binding universal stress UspA family protein
MGKKMIDLSNPHKSNPPVVLIAVDFSDCSHAALEKARELVNASEGSVVVLHVIDHDFIKACMRHRLGEKSRIKKELFLEAKTELGNMLRRTQMDASHVEAVVTEGVPYLEINRMAEKYDADMIVMGSCGMVGDTNAVFFGGTTEKVLRFISRPVLCIPPNSRAHKTDVINHTRNAGR